MSSVMKIHREQIIETAMSLLDRDGLEGVTIRKVAGELHVQPGALYWHVHNKQELIDEMANAILMEQFAQLEGPTSEQDWSDWLQTTYLRLRRAMLAHREGARVVAGAGFGRATTLATLVKLTIHSLVDKGFPLRQAYLTCTTMLSYVYGFVIEEQAAPPDDPAYDDESILADVFRENESHGYTLDTDFLSGLQLILIGTTHALTPSS
jgi:TetR/AcrR family transcriptional regulator, tetracycline repressor protein